MVLNYLEKISGYDEDSSSILFDMDKVKADEQSIRYLYGQLKMMHEYDAKLTAQKAQKRYDGKLWTCDRRSINGIFTFRKYY